MNHLIAIETSADVCSVAGFIRGRRVGHLLTDEPRSHSRVLVPMILELLQKYLNDRVDCIAVSDGPGSFTGLRIGVSTAKGLAFGRDAKIISVPTLESVAAGLLRADVKLTSCIVVAPSRKGEVYYGLYERSALGSSHRSRIEKAVTIPEFESVVLESPSVPVYQTTLNLTDTAVAVVKPDAIEVGYCALGRLDRKEFEDISSFEPYYLKAFHAKKPKQSALDRLPF